MWSLLGSPVHGNPHTLAAKQHTVGGSYRDVQGLGYRVYRVLT